MGKKRPWVNYQYEPLDIENFTEAASATGAKMENITNADVLKLYDIFRNNQLKHSYELIELNQKNYSEKTFLVNTSDGDSMQAYNDLRPTLIFNKRSLNTIRHLNTLLNRTNEALADGGYLWCHARTAVLKKELIMHNHLPVIREAAYFLHYFWHRFCPKIPILKTLYFGITQGKNRTYNRVEILGRMCRAGFQIVDEEFLHGEFFVLGRKIKAPIWDDEPTCGPLVKLRRIGKDGNIIGVYKFRTMYSYSEYLQEYMYSHTGLQDGGKFKDDYRVNGWGRFLRAVWLDELPMIINLFKGQLKLVGVRPLSHQYFSLYTPDMQQLRIKVKPGLIPPFYYEKETPKTVQEVQDSERRYIEQYLQAPFRTDWRYFWGTFGNIIFRHKRSR